MRLGEGFRAPEPERAPEPDPVELLLRQLLAEMRQRPTEPLVVPAPEVRVEAPAPDLSELFAIVASQKPGATADEIAAAVARHLSPPEHGESPLFAELLTAIKALESRVHGVGMQAFGSSGPSNISSDATRRIGIVSGEGNMGDLATDTTLASVLAAVDGVEPKLDTLNSTDFATQTTLAAILSELQSQPTYFVAEGEAAVGAGATFVTVAAVTVGSDAVVHGFNADLVAALDTRYRLRLITGTDVSPTIHVQEQITTNSNSWIPTRLSVISGTRVAVQVVHGEVTAQTVRGAINYSTG